VPDSAYFGERGRSYQACGGNRSALVYRVATALRTGYDLVIAGHVNLAPLLSFGLPGQRPPARVTLIYGIDAWSRLPWMRRIALQHSDRVVAISRFTADAATQANNLDSNKVDVVPCCLDPLFSVPDPQSDLLDADDFPALGRNSLLTVSRLSLVESSKGHMTVLRSMPRVLQSVPDVTYAIVGVGDLQPVLERLTSELGIGDHVRFLGALSDDDLRRCYRTCGAYVMPCKWEGFGLVFLEAMAYARPIIAGNLDAAPEVVGDTALLVDPDDAEELARAIVRLLSDGQLQIRLGQAGRARLAEHFTYARFRASLMAVLGQAVAYQRPVAVRVAD